MDEQSHSSALRVGVAGRPTAAARGVWKISISAMLAVVGGGVGWDARCTNRLEEVQGRNTFDTRVATQVEQLCWRLGV